MRTLIAVLLSLSLTACAGLNPPDAYFKAEQARVEAQSLLAEQPTISMSNVCPCDDGKPGLSFTYRDPRMVQDIKPVVMPDGNAAVAMKALDTVGLGVRVGGAVLGVRELGKAIGDKNYNIDNSGDGSLTFNNDTHANSLSTLDGEQNITGDTSGDTSGDVVTETATTTSTTTTEQSYSYSDSYNTSNPVTTDNSVTNPVIP